MKRITVKLELAYEHKDGPEVGDAELAAKALEAAELAAAKLKDTIPVIRWWSAELAEEGESRPEISHYTQSAKVIAAFPNTTPTVEVPSSRKKVADE